MSEALWSIYQKRGFWYLNARKLGGGQRALIPEGGTKATTDKRTAMRLAQAIVSKIEADKTNAERLGYNPSLALRAYGERFLNGREKTGGLSAGWLAHSRDYLLTAVHYFEDVQPSTVTSREDRRRMAAPRNMASITAPDVLEFQDWLRQQPNGRGGTYSEQTVRHHCTVLSRIYRRAVQLGQIDANPVQKAGLPAAPESDTPLLEAETVALALEAARLVEAEAVAADDPRQSARQIVHVALVLLAYTGSRMDECERVEWADLLEMGAAGEYMVRLFSANKGARAGRRRRSTRLVPLSPHAVPVLQAWRVRSGRIAGPILADPATGHVPSFAKAFAAVERRAGLPSGTLGSRTLRVAYATHRATCDGVSWNDVRDELGHADLRMQGQVYGRGRLNREPMGEVMDYRFSRWAGRLGDAAAHLASTTSTPDRWMLGKPAREAVVRAFLASIEGMGKKRAMTETGVDKSVIERLRKGAASDVKGPTLERMREHLKRIGGSIAAA
jgi:integrase